MMPLVRQGLHSKNDIVHSYFVQILCQVCRNFAASASSSFCGDLNILIREDDAELDFFLNTSHVQIHRRARALARLRREFLGTSTQSCSFTQSSLSNILLPLALRPLYSDKPSEDTYALEAVATVGKLSVRATICPKLQNGAHLLCYILVRCNCPTFDMA
jgi:U3 small nucleolar RNA-associated protein 20